MRTALFRGNLYGGSTFGSEGIYHTSQTHPDTIPLDTPLLDTHPFDTPPTQTQAGYTPPHIPIAGHTPLPPHTPTEQNDWQTVVKTLPCPKRGKRGNKWVCSAQ